MIPKFQLSNLSTLFSVSDLAKTAKLIDQNETIQIRFTKGFRIIYKESKKFPKQLATVTTSIEKRQFQNKPMMFPANNMDNFLVNFPLNGKIRETKRKLKIISINTDSLPMPAKDKSMYETIAPAENPKIRWSILNSLFSIFLSLTWLLEVDSRRTI
jgi:hypothetical protein